MILNIVKGQLESMNIKDLDPDRLTLLIINQLFFDGILENNLLYE